MQDEEYNKNRPFSAPDWLIDLAGKAAADKVWTRSLYIREALKNQLIRDGYLDERGRRLPRAEATNVLRN